MITAAQVEQMELSLVEAIKRSDVNSLDQILHNELRAMGPDGRIITKDMDLGAHRSGGMVVHELEASIEEINIIGDSAISVVVYDTKGEILGQPLAGQLKYLRVWKKFDDELKVIAASCFKL